jgi:hypothetical protein
MHLGQGARGAVRSSPGRARLKGRLCLGPGVVYYAIVLLDRSHEPNMRVLACMIAHLVCWRAREHVSAFCVLPHLIDK